MDFGRRKLLNHGLSVGLAVSLTSGLAACGFRPVYGTGSSDGGFDVNRDLAATKVSVIEGRFGQILHNYLLDRFNPKGQPTRSLYSLSTDVTISSSELGTQIDATTTRSQVSVSVSSKLTAFDEVKAFSARSVATFSTADSVYASKVAEEAAIERSMRVIADDLRLQIATYFEKHRLLQGG